MESKLLVSVIVPIYNREKYLKRCIESILNQTYRNLEIILIDDGSTDNSSQICDLYANEDNRVTVIHQKNNGNMNARKQGVLHATGRYTVYVDSDDWIEEDWVEKLIEAMNENCADLVCTGHIVDYGCSNKVEINCIEKGNYLVDEIIEECMYKGQFYSFGITQYVWSKMFRTDILRDVQVNIPDNISMGEDVAITFNYILKIKKIYVTEYDGYHYIQHANSLCSVRQDNEIEKCNRLITYLKESLLRSEWSDILKNQLNQYIKLLLLSRCFQLQDKAFGYIPEQSRLVIYGAGAIGRSVIDTMKKEPMQIVAWLDRDYLRLQREGFDILNPEDYKYNSESYDFIIVAIANEQISKEIVKFLVSKGANKEKIRTITQEYITRNVLD